MAWTKMPPRHRQMAEDKRKLAAATPVTCQAEADVLIAAEQGRRGDLMMERICAHVGWLGQGCDRLTLEGQNALNDWRNK